MNDSDRDSKPDAKPESERESERESGAGRPMQRRRFLHLIAAGGAAAAAAGLAGSAAAETPAAKARPPRAAKKPIPPAVERELASQRKTIADMLKVIRDYELPPGSDPAVSFRAIRSAKARRGGF